MIRCPDCGHENIDGEEFCLECEQPLLETAPARPAWRAEERILNDPVHRLVPREPLVIAPETPVGEAMRRMVDRGVGCAVAVSAHKVVGIFTERDVLLKLNVRAAELTAHPVSEFMTHSVETLELDDRIAFALHKMDVGGYRHIPILRNGRITGVISVRDILNYIAALLEAGEGGDDSAPG